jgi:hypothetical protein
MLTLAAIFGRKITKNDLNQIPNYSFVQLLMLNELPEASYSPSAGLIPKHVSQTFGKCGEKANAS